MHCPDGRWPCPPRPPGPTRLLATAVTTGDPSVAAARVRRAGGLTDIASRRCIAAPPQRARRRDRNVRSSTPSAMRCVSERPAAVGDRELAAADRADGVPVARRGGRTAPRAAAEGGACAATPRPLTFCLNLNAVVHDELQRPGAPGTDAAGVRRGDARPRRASGSASSGTHEAVALVRGLHRRAGAAATGR